MQGGVAMSADLDIHHVEARQGFAEQSGGHEPGRQHARGLPWQRLLDALEAGDVELARRRFRELLAEHPSWRQSPLIEIGTLISSANHSAALARLKALRSPAYLVAAHEPISPRPAVSVRGGTDIPEIIGLKLDLSA